MTEKPRHGRSARSFTDHRKLHDKIGDQGEATFHRAVNARALIAQDPELTRVLNLTSRDEIRAAGRIAGWAGTPSCANSIT